MTDSSPSARSLSAPGPEIRTDRLLLRRWQSSDLEPFALMNADPRVMEHFPARLSRAESDALVDRIKASWDRDGYGQWALERLADGAFLGFAGLSSPGFEAPFTPCIEVGWRLAVDAWGHGYATEAARAAVDYGFERLGLAEIVSFTVPANRRSRAVMERLGMRRDPAVDFNHPRLPEGHPLRRHVLYRLSRETWTAVPAAGTAREPDVQLGDGAVVLRPADERDLAAIEAGIHDPDVVHWLGRPEGSASEVLVLNRNRWAEGSPTLAVCEADGSCVGLVWVNRRPDAPATGHLGYWLLPAARGRGLATRAVRLISSWALGKLGIRTLRLVTEPANVHSQRVAERSGFTRIGIVPGGGQVDGRPVDLVVYSLMPETTGDGGR